MMRSQIVPLSILCLSIMAQGAVSNTSLEAPTIGKHDLMLEGPPTEEIDKDLMNSCYQTDNVECCDEQPIYQFPADSLDQCTQYCQYYYHCHFLAFNYKTGMCALLNNPVAPAGGQFSTIGNATCIWIVQRALELKKPVEEFQSRISGKTQLNILVRRGNSRQCLKVTEKNIKWGACEDTSQWIVLPILNENQGKRQIRIKHKLSGKCVASKSAGSKVAATLEVCSRSSTTQTFQLVPVCPYGISPDYTSIAILTTHFDRVFLCIKCKKQLFDLTFETMEEHLGPCDQQMDIRNGAVISNTLAPFLLPGSQVTVQCYPGYEYNNATTFQFKCQNNFVERPGCQHYVEPGHSGSFVFRVNLAASICFFNLFTQVLD